MNTVNAIISFFSVLLIAVVVRAEDPKQSQTSLQSVPVELQKKSQFEFWGMAEINAVNVGEDNSLLLRLKNNTGSTIRFGEPSTTCGCVKVVLQSDELLDGSECDLQIHLKPDRSYKEQIWQQTVSFAPKEKGAQIVTIAVRAALNGVFVAEP